MLPPVAALSDAFLGSFTQSNHTPLDPRVQIGATLQAVPAQAAAAPAQFAGDRLSIMSLSGQLQLAQGLSVVAETLGTILKVERHDGETLADYAERLGEVMSGLSPSERIALQKALNQLMKGVTLRMLTEILKNPVGPEATRLALQLETDAYLVREPLAKKVVTSYRQNGGTDLPLAPLPKPAIRLEAGTYPAAQAGRLALQSGVAPNAGIPLAPSGIAAVTAGRIDETAGRIDEVDSLFLLAEEPEWPTGGRLPPQLANNVSAAPMVDAPSLPAALRRTPAAAAAVMSYPEMDGYEAQDPVPATARAQVSAARPFRPGTAEATTSAPIEKTYIPDQVSASRSLPASPPHAHLGADLPDELDPRAASDARSSAGPVMRTVAVAGSMSESPDLQAESTGSSALAAAAIDRSPGTALAAGLLDSAASDDVTYDGPALARMGLPAVDDEVAQSVADHDGTVATRPAQTPPTETTVATPKASRLQPALVQALVEEVGVSGNWLAGIYAEESQDAWLAATASVIAAGEAPQQAAVSTPGKPMPALLDINTLAKASSDAVANSSTIANESIVEAARATAHSDAEPDADHPALPPATTGRTAEAAAAAQASAAAQAAPIHKAVAREAIVPIFVPYPPQSAYEDEERHLIEAVEAVDADGSRNRQGGRRQQGDEGEAEGQLADQWSTDTDLDGDPVMDAEAEGALQMHAASAGHNDAEAFYQRMADW